MPGLDQLFPHIPTIIHNVTTYILTTFSTGGLVQSMKWDPTGERLVVSFASQCLDENDEYEESGLLCVFSTKVTSSNIVIAPLGFIRGEPEETAVTFEFARHFRLGALLTIVSDSKNCLA